MAAYSVWRLMLYDVEKHEQSELYKPPTGYPSWSPDSQLVFFQNSDRGIFRVRIRDRKVERLGSAKGIPRINWGWLAAVPNDSLMLARDTSIEAVYALDLELP